MIKKAILQKKHSISFKSYRSLVKAFKTLTFTNLWGGVLLLNLLIWNLTKDRQLALVIFIIIQFSLLTFLFFKEESKRLNENKELNENYLTNYLTANHIEEPFSD